MVSALIRGLATLLSARGPSSRRWEVWLVMAALALALGGHVWIGVRADFLPCTLDCGETYEAHIGARNLYRFGWRYAGGLQDYSASPDPATHPTVYVHNPNLGMYVLWLLFHLGVQDIHTQAAVLTLPFLGGLLYLFLAVKAVTRDGVLAALCLLSAASCYLLVALWGGHAVRVWSFLLTWGMTYHLVRAFEHGPVRGRHLVAASLMIAASLGVDYPFGLFVGSLALALAWVGLVPIPMRRVLLIVLIALGVPFLLRQVQVAAVLGVGFWWFDLLYSVGRRVPLASLAFSVPDSLTLSRYYDAHHAIKWPGGGGAFIPLTWTVVFIRAHVATLGVASVGLILAGLVAPWGRRAVAGPMQPTLALLAAIGVAIVVTLTVFGEYLSVFYGAILMPLGVHWVVVLLGMTSYVLVAHRRCKISLRLRKRSCALPVGVMLLTAFVLWRVGTEVRNTVVLPPVGYPGREALAELRGQSVATLWISSAPSAYTDQWAATLNTMRWLVKVPHRFEFDPAEDYYMFFEVDRDNLRYRRPDFLLVPRLQVWGLGRTCRPLSGWVLGFADGCADLTGIAAQLAATVPTAPYRSSKDFLLYDLRQLRRD